MGSLCYFTQVYEMKYEEESLKFNKKLPENFCFKKEKKVNLIFYLIKGIFECFLLKFSRFYSKFSHGRKKVLLNHRETKGYLFLW